MRAAASDFGGRDGRMLAARVEQKNGTYLNNIQRDRQSSPSLHSSPYLVPILAPFTLRHLYAGSDSRSQAAAVRVFLDESNKDLVCERTWLTEARIGTDRNTLFIHTLVQLDLTYARRCAFGVVTKQSAGDAQQVALHINLVRMLPITCFYD